MQMQCRASNWEGNRRSLERPRGDHNVLRLEKAGWSFDDQAAGACRAIKRGCRKAAAQWRPDKSGVALDEAEDFTARCKCIRIGRLKRKPGQTNVPVRTLESQRVPSP